MNATFDEVNYVGYGNLATDGYLRVGGYRKLPFGMTQNLYNGFQGCIAEFKIDERLIDLITNNLNTKYYPNLCTFSNGNFSVFSQTKKARGKET